MANDKSKIIAESGDVYIAATGATWENTSDLSSWTLLGWCEGGSIKLAVADRNEIELHNSSKFKLSLNFRFEAIGLETTLAQIQALESLEGEESVDIAVVINPSVGTGFAGWRFNKFGLMVDPEFVFSEKIPRKVKIEGTRTAQNLSAIYAAVNYAGTPP